MVTRAIIGISIRMIFLKDSQVESGLIIGYYYLWTLPTWGSEKGLGGKVDTCLGMCAVADEYSIANCRGEELKKGQVASELCRPALWISPEPVGKN